MAMEAVSSTQPSAKMDANNFKGKLFGYAQAHGFGDPNYTFENNGLPHAPHFRATAHVVGNTYTAPETFKRCKEAENFISKSAFESLSHQALSSVVSPSFLKGWKLCKTILYEYCVKKDNMVLPSHNTKVPNCGPSTVFLSEVVYDNDTFVGPLSKSKKEAEQDAALVVITSLLENSETRFLMSEVIQKVVPAIAGCAEFASNQNPNPNDNAASRVDLVEEPAKVTEMNASVSPGWILTRHMILFMLNAEQSIQSILKEYSDKKGCKVPPEYNTHTHELVPLQAHVSVVSFEGKVYHGPQSKSKKEAEQAAARVAVDCILGNPESKIFMLHAIQSKIKLNPSWNVSLISNPTTDQLNPAPGQVSTDSKTKSGMRVPLWRSHKSSTGPAGSVLGQSEETINENRPAVGLSKNAPKRARRKERDLEAKKVKLNLLVNSLC